MQAPERKGNFRVRARIVRFGHVLCRSFSARALDFRQMPRLEAVRGDITAETTDAVVRHLEDLLRRRQLGLAEVAQRVGYGSASTFSTAFSRHVGQPPSRYAASLP